MFSGHKTFSTFNGPQKPLRFVRVNSVLDIFAVRKQLKIIQTIVGSVQIFMINFHPFWDRAYKRFPHSAVNGYFSVFPFFAGAKTNIMVARNMRLDGPSVAVADPCFAVLDIERGGNTSTEKRGHRAQRSTIGEHGFCRVNLFGGKQFPPRHTPYARKIANFVKAFVAANWFPNLHTVDIKPVYVGGQA